MTTAHEQPESVSFGSLTFLRGRRQGKYPYCHTLIVNDEGLVVIDPSADKAICRRLARDPALTAILVSHFHEDHQKYLTFFPDELILVPAAETAAFASLTGVFSFMGLEDPVYRAYWQKTLMAEFHFRPRPDLKTFAEGSELQFGRTLLQVFHTPGHTPGHSCFYFPQESILYLADFDLTSFGPWYGDQASDLEALMASLQRLAEIPARVYLTAHGQGVFGAAAGRQALQRFRQVIFDREAELLRRLQRPLSLHDLVQQRLIYRKSLEPKFVYDHIERQMISKHLARLLKDGKIRETEEGYVATGRNY